MRGASLKAVQELLGHESIEMTLRNHTSAGRQARDGAPARQGPGSRGEPRAAEGTGAPTNRGLNWSGKRDLNPRPSPWQGDALPLSYSRRKRAKEAGYRGARERVKGRTAASVGGGARRCHIRGPRDQPQRPCRRRPLRARAAPRGGPPERRGEAAPRAVGGGTTRGAAGTGSARWAAPSSSASRTPLWPRPRAALPPPGAIRKVLVIRVTSASGTSSSRRRSSARWKLGPRRGAPPPRAEAGPPRRLAAPSTGRSVAEREHSAHRGGSGLLRALRAERYDLVVEAGHWSAFSLTAALVARIVGRDGAVGHDRGDSAVPLHPVPHDRRTPSRGLKLEPSPRSASRAAST